MTPAQPVLEAPAPGPLEPPPDVDAGRQAEPVLAADQIQGNIFPGFNKDAQTLLFLRIADAAAFAAWLRDFIPSVATTERVIPVRRVLKNIRSATGAEATGIELVWANIAFTFRGLKKLESPGLKLDDFKDEAFKAGLLARSATPDGDLGDPIGSGQPGDPAGWVLGGPDNEPDAVLILGGDTRDHLNREAAKFVATLFPRTDARGQLVGSGAEIILREDGDTLKPPLTGHEHFGFRDGISQPGVRGRLPDGSFLTPSQNPLDDGQGKPGQDLLWPGEFVFGYPGQDGTKEVSEPGTDPLKSKTRGAPEFARNGRTRRASWARNSRDSGSSWFSARPSTTIQARRSLRWMVRAMVSLRRTGQRWTLCPCGRPGRGGSGRPRRVARACARTAGPHRCSRSSLRSRKRGCSGFLGVPHGFRRQTTQPRSRRNRRNATCPSARGR
jgi:hypothetical protein